MDNTFRDQIATPCQCASCRAGRPVTPYQRDVAEATDHKQLSDMTQAELDQFTLVRNTPNISDNRLPEGSAERKDIPIVSGVLDYFPDAIAYLARLSKYGNDKHNPGEPLHWTRGKSNDHADCIARHLVDRGGFDAEGWRHSGYLAWRALANLQVELEAAEGKPVSRGSQ